MRTQAGFQRLSGFLVAESEWPELVEPWGRMTALNTKKRYTEEQV